MEWFGQACQKLRPNKASPRNSFEYDESTLQKTVCNTNITPSPREGHFFKSQIGRDVSKTLRIPRNAVRAWKKKVAFSQGSQLTP